MSERRIQGIDFFAGYAAGAVVSAAMGLPLVSALLVATVPLVALVAMHGAVWLLGRKKR